MKNRPFLSHHTHDNIGSIRDCTASVEEMFKICSKNNMSFSSTNHGYAASFAEIYKQSKKYNVKPVFGVEFYLSQKRDRLFFIRSKLEELKNIKTNVKEEKEKIDDEIRVLNIEFEEIKKYNHICVIAKNLHGYRNLIELHNIATLTSFYHKPLLSLKDLFNCEKDKAGDRGLVVTSACLGGVIPQNFLKGKDAHAEEHALIMKEEFRDNWFLEVQAHELQEQREVNRKIISLSKKVNVPLIIGTDSHYISPEYSRSHEIFLLLQGEQKVSDIGKKVFRITYETPRGETKRKKLDPSEEWNGVLCSSLKEGDTFYKKKISKDKWDAKIKKIEEVNKVWMIESADLSFKTESQLRTHLRKFDELSEIENDLIESNKDVYEKIENFDWDNDLKLPIIDKANDILFDECVSSLKSKGLYNKTEYIEIFKMEFSVIKSGGLSSYFLILKDIIDFAKSRRIPVGPARGSSGASLIVYLLGITRIDPLLWDFNFERFLNTKKISSDSERIRITKDGIDIDLRPNEEVKLKNGIIKKAKDLKIGDEI
jgi:DNA polymerase-3 subunit alpha